MKLVPFRVIVVSGEPIGTLDGLIDVSAGTGLLELNTVTVTGIVMLPFTACGELSVTDPLYEPMARPVASIESPELK